MSRAAQSSAISHWLLSEYLESPLLALTLIQPCQPSVVSSARAACSMRSRSALRRASRSSSVRGRRLKRRAIVGSLRVGPAPGGGPIPRHPHARQGVPPSGGESARRPAALGLRGVVEVLVELVADD